MKKNKFIAICPKCSNPILEKITWKKRIFKVSKTTLLGVLLLTSLIGTLGIYNFLIVGVYDNPDAILTIGGAYATIENIRSHFQSDDRLKEISFNLTKECEDDYCKSKKIYEHLLTFKYEEGEESDPLVIWDEKKCDCDECSFLYKSFLLKQNISSIIQANHNHAWVVLKLKNQTILADITKQEWKEY